MNGVQEKRGIILVLLSAITFSLAGVLIKFIPWSSMSINGARNIFAFAIMCVYMRMTGHKIVVNKSVLFCAVAYIIANYTFVIATKVTSAANAIVLQFTAPIFIILFMWLFFKVTPKKLEVTACALVFTGICCFFLDKISLKGMYGNVIAIISGATYAVTFIVKKIPKSDYESSVLMGQGLSVLIGIPFVCQETVFTPIVLLLIAVLGTVQLGLSFVLLGIGLKTVQPVTASLISTIEPVLNPILVAIFYHETIGTLSLIGAAIVVITVAVYNVASAKRG